MTRERYVLLGLARARADWFRTIGHWATSAMLPAEFVRCVSLGELRVRLRSGRTFSAVIVDGTLPGLDRDLIAEADEVGVAVLVVDDGPRDWRELGAAAVVASRFSRDELLTVLEATARPVGAATLEHVAGDRLEPERAGTVVAVTGPGGTGASTVAIALAQGLASGYGDEPRSRRAGGRSPAQRPQVLLADLCRTADQAMLHDSSTVVPSIQELVEAHRTAAPQAAAVMEQTFAVPARGYRLLLGLRRPRHWVTLRSRALESTLDSLQRLAEIVVLDVEADVEGEAETGSVDVEERNLLARTGLARAEVVLVVGEASMKGLAAAVRTIGELVAFGVPIERVLPVVNRAPRSPRRRAEITTALQDLVHASVGAPAGALAAPVQLAERAVDDALRDGVALPVAMARSLARGVAAVRDRAGPLSAPPDAAPVRVVPGHRSSFTAQEPPSTAQEPPSL